MNDVLMTIVGVAVGLVTGFYFERRATRVAQAESALTQERNRLLELQLDELRDEMRKNLEATYSRGGGPALADPLILDVKAAAMACIKASLNASGRVAEGVVVRRLVNDGHARRTIEEAIAALVAEQRVRTLDHEFEIV